MKFKNFLDEGRDEAISILKRDAKKMGLTFHPKWEDFVKKNFKVIDKETKKIQKDVGRIVDTKLRDKKYKNELRDFKIRLTALWGAMKDEL